MVAISRASLAWLPPPLTEFGGLKTPSLPEDQIVVLPLLILFICVTGSITLVLRSRQRRHTTGASTVNTLRAELRSSCKAQGRRYSTKVNSHIDPHCLVRPPATKTNRLGLRLAMTMLLAIPCVLLFLWHVRLVLATHDGYRAIERSPGQTSDSTGSQEVFQVYQPVFFAPEGLTSCDLHVLLMDHVFGQSYGKPFVGASEVLR